MSRCVWQIRSQLSRDPLRLPVGSTLFRQLALHASAISMQVRVQSRASNGCFCEAAHPTNAARQRKSGEKNASKKNPHGEHGLPLQNNLHTRHGLMFLCSLSLARSMVRCYSIFCEAFGHQSRPSHGQAQRAPIGLSLVNGCERQSLAQDIW